MNNSVQAKRFSALRRNKFYLFWCRFFVELNALQAIIQLFYLQRGVTLPQIFYLSVAWSLATILFDLPSSLIADKWGRKKAIIIGVLINILANFGLFFTYGFIPFFINTFILSISFSFFASIEDAFLFDTLKEMKQEGVVLKTSGKYGVAAKASKMFTPLIGVLIAGGLTASQLNILLSINFLSSCIALTFALLLVEPKRQVSSPKPHLDLLRESLNLLVKSDILRKIAMNKTFIFIASFVFWKNYQKSLVDLGSSIFMLGLLYLMINSLTILIFSKTEYIFNKIEKSLIFSLPVWITLVGSFIFAFSSNLWLSFLITPFLIITGIIRDPFFNQQIQWRLESENRATSGSALSFLKSILDIPLLLLSGYLSSLNPQAVLLVPVLLSFISLIFFRIKKEEILTAP